MRSALFGPVLVLALLLAGWCAPVQAQSDPKAGMAADALRLLQQHDASASGAAASRKRDFLAPTPAATLGQAEFARFLDSGAASLRGIEVRDTTGLTPGREPYYEGRFRRVHHAYLDRELVGYDEGVYVVPGEAAYVGTFHYFGQPTEDWFPFAKGSYVVVGRKLSWDGAVEPGIYIAEQATAGVPLHFVRATPAYLERFERQHAAAVESYERQLAAEAASGGIDFGAVLALGFGAALIGSSDLPGLDKLQLGQALLSDVSGAGDGQALMRIANAGLPGGGIFSGKQSFQAPGLDSLLSGGVTGQGSAAEAGFGGTLATLGGVATGQAGSPSPAAAIAPAVAAPSAAPASETYSFTCPAGDSHALPVSYRNPACGAAMKNLARVYGCNLIGDFASAGQQCQQACGHPQCAEAR